MPTSGDRSRFFIGPSYKTPKLNGLIPVTLRSRDRSRSPTSGRGVGAEASRRLYSRGPEGPGRRRFPRRRSGRFGQGRPHGGRLRPRGDWKRRPRAKPFEELFRWRPRTRRSPDTSSMRSGEMKYLPAGPELVSIYDGNVSNLGDRALRSLALMGAPEARGVFYYQMTSKLAEQRRWAAEGLGRLSDESLIPGMMKDFLREPDPSVQLAYCFALTKLGQREFVDRIALSSREQEASGPGPRVRRRARKPAPQRARHLPVGSGAGSPEGDGAGPDGDRGSRGHSLSEAACSPTPTRRSRICANRAIARLQQGDLSASSIPF